MANELNGSNTNEANETQHRLLLESLIESLFPPGTRRRIPSHDLPFFQAAALPTNNTNEEERKDVDFAITESQMHFDWSKAGMVLLDSFHSSPTKYMVRTTNSVGGIPQFCDSEYFRNEGDYYVLHQEEGEEDEPEGREIPFSQQHFERWIQQLQDEVIDAEWRRQPSQTTAAVGTEPQQAALGLSRMWEDYEHLPAKVLAFRTDRGDRLEYWTAVNLTENVAPGYAPAGDHAYIILQTAGGRVLIVGVTHGHPFIICNLLQFDNSDGSTPDLSDTVSLEEADGANLLNGQISLAREFLFQQQH